jgi:hypothetical protein
MNTIPRIVLVVLAFTVTYALRATPISFNYTLQVVAGPSDLVTPGQLVPGSFTIESSTPDALPSSNVEGLYIGAVTNITMSATNPISFGSMTSQVYVVSNNFFDGNYYSRYWVYANAVTGGPGSLHNFWLEFAAIPKTSPNSNFSDDVIFQPGVPFSAIPTSYAIVAMSFSRGKGWSQEQIFGTLTDLSVASHPPSGVPEDGSTLTLLTPLLAALFGYKVSASLNRAFRNSRTGV